MDIRIIRGMDERRVGSALRAIRRHRRWSLEHAAARAGLSSATASRIETGRLDRCSFHALDAYSRTLGADLSFSLRWRSGDLDRLLNRRHSYMHERMARIWQGLPEWQAVPEHSFSIFGERGVIDWFSWHGGSRTVLIEELKSQFVDVQELVGTNDRRMRLAPMIARALGWNPRLIASWVLVDDTRTNRRHLAQHAMFLRSAFPADGRTMAAWLRHPEGPIRALSFLPSVQHANAGRVSRMPLVGRAGDLIVPPRLDDGRLARSAASGDPIELDEEALAGFLRS